MKAGLTGIALLAMSLVYGTHAAAQEVAYARNSKVATGNKLPAKSLASEDISDFILSAAYARMICAEEGRLAAEKGTTPGIREYGKLMIKDQGRLLGELKRLAVLNGVSIPDRNYEIQLAQKSGRQFNNAFVKTMIMEHERDIKIFKEAIADGDPEVSEFASRYLPLIESNLKKIKSIKR